MGAGFGAGVFGLCVWDKWECSAAGARFGVWFCLACPPGRLLIASPYSSGAIRIVLFGNFA